MEKNTSAQQIKRLESKQERKALFLHCDIKF